VQTVDQVSLREGFGEEAHCAGLQRFRAHALLAESAASLWVNVPERRRLAALMVWQRDGNNTKQASFIRKYGAGEWTRTTDLLITNQLLYQLSYAGLAGT
jgi:hypothetical protein